MAMWLWLGCDSKLLGTLQYEAVQILLDDHVLNGVHGGFEEGGIGSVGVVDVDLPLGDTGDASETVGEVGCSGVIIVLGAVVIGEVFRNGGDGKFFFEKIDLVQEENDWLSLEPFAVY